MSTNKEKLVVVTLRLPRPLWGQVKRLATERDQKVESVVAELLRTIFSNDEPRKDGGAGS